MSLDDLLRAVPSARPVRSPDPPGGEALRPLAWIERADFRGRPFQVEFLFEPAGRLGAIRLLSPGVDRPDLLFDEVVATLTSEHGPPVSTRHGDERTGAWRGLASWAAGSARLELEGWSAGAPDARVYTVDLRRGSVRPLQTGGIALTLSPGSPSGRHRSGGQADQAP
jgi:hypothetical protein